MMLEPNFTKIDPLMTLILIIKATTFRGRDLIRCGIAINNKIKWISTFITVGVQCITKMIK